MNLSEKARLYRELAKMLEAGFHLDRSVELLSSQKLTSGSKGYVDGLRRGFQDRLSLSDAVRSNNAGAVTELEQTLIDAGEVSGRLGESFRHLATYFETMQKGISQARGALVYPLVVLHMGVLVPAFAEGVLVSQIETLSRGSTSTTMLGVGLQVAKHLAVFWLGLLLIWWLWRAACNVARSSGAVDRLLGMIPLIGSVRRHWALARFCQVFHSALLAAMRMTDCIDLAGAASQSGVIRSGARAAADQVAGGKALAESFRASGAFSAFFVNSLATAEAAGGLDREMERWAKAESENAQEAQRRAAELYPKALHVVIMLYVGWRIVSLAQSYFGALGNLTNLGG
jgi:type II secretory pathway component PulF